MASLPILASPPVAAASAEPLRLERERAEVRLGAWPADGQSKGSAHLMTGMSSPGNS
jgi:hypothetical protein